MTRIDAAAFYSTLDGAPQQGDILLGAVSRVVADDAYAPPRWDALDEHSALLDPEFAAGTVTVPALRVTAGRALVMVCSHDCGLDKEFNALVDGLVDPRGDSRLREDTAAQVAEDDVSLDRSLTVSPLIDPASVTVAGVPVDRGLLMAGRIVGYLPVPELQIDGRVIIPDSVVDLGYRSTLDRFAYTQRITCISELGRTQLRYAMARLDVLRTPTLEAQLELAVGQVITSASVTAANPLMIRLTLADGSAVELLMKPGSPTPGPKSRTRRSVRGGE